MLCMWRRAAKQLDTVRDTWVNEWMQRCTSRCQLLTYHPQFNVLCSTWTTSVSGWREIGWRWQDTTDLARYKSAALEGICHWANAAIRTDPVPDLCHQPRTPHWQRTDDVAPYRLCLPHWVLSAEAATDCSRLTYHGVCPDNSAFIHSPKQFAWAGHANWLFSSYTEDVSFWSVLGTLSALEALFATMRYIN